MTDCPTCRELRERAEFLQRFDFRDGREAWLKLDEHKTRDHIFHIATARDALYPLVKESIDKLGAK